jgi:hypothetical protein
MYSFRTFEWLQGLPDPDTILRQINHLLALV